MRYDLKLNKFVLFVTMLVTAKWNSVHIYRNVQPVMSCINSSKNSPVYKNTQRYYFKLGVQY